MREDTRSYLTSSTQTESHIDINDQSQMPNPQTPQKEIHNSNKSSLKKRKSTHFQKRNSALLAPQKSFNAIEPPLEIPIENNFDETLFDIDVSFLKESEFSIKTKINFFFNSFPSFL